jgi:hypothetical protein
MTVFSSQLLALFLAVMADDLVCSKAGMAASRLFYVQLGGQISC